MEPTNESRQAGESGRTVGGVRLSAIVEIALFLGVALVIDKAFLDGHRFQSMPWHPFWILVLLVSVQYGTNAALLAAAAASGALLIGNIPSQPISQDRFAWLFELGRLPLLWFVSAVVLGELRVRQIRERDDLRRQFEETAGRERLLADAYKKLGGVRDALETRLASQLKTAVGMYESARAIEKLDPSEVLMGMANLIHSVMTPEKFSAWLLQNGQLDLAVHEGWSEAEHMPHHYTQDSQLFVEIVARQRVLSVANSDDAFALAGAGMVAAPIVVPDTGRVIGMLKIEKLGFLDLTFSNLQMLRVLCQWIGAAYDNAVRYQAARAESVMNAETELLAYGYLSRQLSFLRALAMRVGFDLTMIVCRLENPDELTDEQRALTPRIFSRCAAQALRKTDLAFDHQRTGTEFAIILPASPVSHAEVVIRKLRTFLDTEMGAGAPNARFTFAVHAIHDIHDMTAEEESTMTLRHAPEIEHAPETQHVLDMQRIDAVIRRLSSLFDTAQGLDTSPAYDAGPDAGTPASPAIRHAPETQHVLDMQRIEAQHV
jgi:hypothetical protein